jgi:hypothetical protein
MKHLKTERRPYKDRPEYERKAIDSYLKTSHPTNIPKNIDRADWIFIEWRNGQITAGC